MTNQEEVYRLEEKVYSAILNARNTPDGEERRSAGERLKNISKRYITLTGRCFNVTNYQRRKGISTE